MSYGFVWRINMAIVCIYEIRIFFYFVSKAQWDLKILNTIKKKCVIRRMVALRYKIFSLIKKTVAKNMSRVAGRYNLCRGGSTNVEWLLKSSKKIQYY